MANANVPRGLAPYRYDSGAPYNGAANLYYVPATYASNIFIGDPVALVDNSADGVGIPAVQLASAGAGNAILGCMVAIAPGGDPQVAVTRDLPPYRQASVGGYILVADDPNLLFLVQEDSVGGALAVGGADRNVNLVSGVGSTFTALSGWQLQSSSVGAGANLQMRLRRLIQEADNAQGVNAKWLCRINLHQVSQQAGV